MSLADSLKSLNEFAEIFNAYIANRCVGKQGDKTLIWCPEGGHAVKNRPQDQECNNQAEKDNLFSRWAEFHRNAAGDTPRLDWDSKQAD